MIPRSGGPNARWFFAGACLAALVLVDRGGMCAFKLKTANAQNAGAIGVIIVDNVNVATPPPLGDSLAVMTPIT